MSSIISPKPAAGMYRYQMDKMESYTGWSVQFTLPVDNPVDNVRRKRVNGGYHFEIPINYPDIHNLTFAQVLLASELKKDIHVVHNP